MKKVYALRAAPLVTLALSYGVAGQANPGPNTSFLEFWYVMASIFLLVGTLALSVAAALSFLED